MTLAIDINASQLEQFAQSLDRIGQRLPAAIDRAVQLTANEGKTYIVQKTPIKTGNLARGFDVIKVKNMVWRIFNLVKYLPFVEENTKPHIIRPKKKKALFFPSAKAFAARTGGTLVLTRAGSVTQGQLKKFGNLAFAHAKYVKHPGTKGKKMMAKSVEQIKKRLDDNIGNTLRELLARKS